MNKLLAGILAAFMLAAAGCNGDGAEKPKHPDAPPFLRDIMKERKGHHEDRPSR